MLDRVFKNKQKASEALLLHTTFESTRITDSIGCKLELYPILDEEELFKGNNSEHFFYPNKVSLNSIESTKDLIRKLWKALTTNTDNLEIENNITVNNNEVVNNTINIENKKTKNIKDNNLKNIPNSLPTENIEFNQFIKIFQYSELNYFSEEHIRKLWKYTVIDASKKSNNNNNNSINNLKNDEYLKYKINYKQFVSFCVDLFQCLKAYKISNYQSEKNQYINEKIEYAVQIMQQHFKELDTENNNEISYKDLRDCLFKENEIFSRKEIEIILKQINPNKNFEYWKFDKILKILYYDYFDYNLLMKQDKLFRFLVSIFNNQDVDQKGYIHYSKMRYALLIQEKLKLNKIQVRIF